MDSIWPEFKEWLLEEKGLARTSVSTYIYQTKRILKEVEPLTESHLRKWESEQPAHHIRSFRSSWNRYSEFFVEKWPQVSLPTFSPRRGAAADEGIPRSVLGAIDACDQAGVPPAVLGTLRTDSIEESKLTALRSVIPQLADGSAQPFSGGNGGIVLVPTEAWVLIRDWAYPDGTKKGSVVLPRCPGHECAMPVPKIKRLLRAHRALRKASQHQPPAPHGE